jgi:hypothetical protein
VNCWHDAIDRASTEDEVVCCAREYLALWAPRELTPITQGWRELRVESPADVRRLKAWLTETSQLRELATYFWHAAARIEEIRRLQVCRVHFGTAGTVSAPLQ